MCQMLNIWHIPHTKPNLSPFSRCGIWYIFCNIEQYRDKFATVRNACAYYLFFVYSSLSHISFSNSSPPPSPLSHISLCSSPSARSTYVPPSPLSHTLSSFLSPFAIFSSHSWIWATTDFLSTITDLICPFTDFFFPFLFALSSLFYLRVAYRVVGLWLWIVGLWLRIVISVGLWVVGISSVFYLESPIRCSSFSERRFAVLSLKVSSIHREPSWFHRFVLRQGFIFVLAFFRYWIWKLEPLPLIGLVFLN